MAATRRPPQRETAHRIADEELRVRLEEELCRHPTRSKLLPRDLRGRALAVAVPALIAGAVVLAWGGGATRGEPPVPPGFEQRAASAARNPSLIVQAPSALPARRHPIGPIRVPRPVHLTVPRLDISTPVSSVGVVGDRIALPPVSRAGWFNAGPRPGEPGRTVIVGHRDTTRGPAVFAELPLARRGDEVTVTDAGGRVLRYRVVSAVSVPKRYFPVARVHASTPDSTIALVTCGGRFDSETGHYELNVLVFAKLAGKRPRQDSNLRPTA